MAAMVAPLVFCLFNFIVAERPSLWAQMLVLGFALSFPSSREVCPEPKVGRFLFTPLVLVVSFWSIVFGFRTLQADALSLQAQTALRGLQLEQAVALYQEAIRLQPNRAMLRQGAADAALRMWALDRNDKALREAILQLEAAVDASPRNLAVLRQLSQVYARADRLPEATQALEDAADAAPGSRVVAQQRLELALRQSDLAQAALLLRETFQRDGTGWNALVETMLALELKAKGQGESLMKAWLGETGFDAQRLSEEVATRAEERGQVAAAGAFYRARLATTPDDLCARAGLARSVGAVEGVARELSLLEEALAAQAVGSDPCQQVALKRWVELALKAGRTSEVQARLAKGLDEYPREDWIRVRLAELLSAQGSEAEAVALLRSGLAERPGSLILNLALAEAYERSGSRDLALVYYRAAQKIDPKEDAGAQRKIEKLLKGWAGSFSYRGQLPVDHPEMQVDHAALPGKELALHRLFTKVDDGAQTLLFHSEKILEVGLG